MRSLRDVRLILDAVTPSADSKLALKVMDREKFDVLAIVGLAGVSGYVTRQDCEGNLNLRCYEFARPLPENLSADTPLRDAARHLILQEQQAVLVEEEGRVQGMASLLQIIDDLSQSRDPLTGLPRNDTLRDWGCHKLEQGQEITLLFIDLNDFRAYNKKYGHVIGDRVLLALAKQVAKFLESADVFVRYAGDEFAIGTTRTREEAAVLAEQIQSQPIWVQGVEKPVSFAIGISGGKRSTERTGVHYAATLDSLINIASQDCLSRKPKSEPAVS